MNPSLQKLLNIKPKEELTLKKTLILLLAMLICLLSLAPAYAEMSISDAGLAVSGSAQQLGKPDSFGSENISVPVPE